MGLADARSTKHRRAFGRFLPPQTHDYRYGYDVRDNPYEPNMYGAPQLDSRLILIRSIAT